MCELVFLNWNLVFRFNYSNKTLQYVSGFWVAVWTLVSKRFAIAALKVQCLILFPSQDCSGEVGGDGALRILATVHLSGLSFPERPLEAFTPTPHILPCSQAAERAT